MSLEHIIFERLSFSPKCLFILFRVVKLRNLKNYKRHFFQLLLLLLTGLSGEINGVSTSCSNYTKYYASSMPVLEDGLSSGHTSDTENNNQNNLNSNLQQPSAAIHHNPAGSGGISMLMDMKRLSTNNSINSMNNLTISTTDGGGGGVGGEPRNNSISSNIIHETMYLHNSDSPTATAGLHEDSGRESVRSNTRRDGRGGERELLGQSPTNICNNKVFKNIDPELDSLYSISMLNKDFIYIF